MEEKVISSASSTYQNVIPQQKNVPLNHSLDYSSPKRGQFVWKNGSKNGLKSKDPYGSNLYPSPLDRIRTKRQMGVINETESKEGFKLVHSSCKTPDPDDISPLEKFRGDSLYSFCYSYSQKKGSYSHSNDHVRSLSSSWVFYNYVGTQPNISFAACIQNPNKAVLTINNRTTEILVANKTACQLLGLSEFKLIGKRLCNYLTFGNGYYLAKETQLESTGEVVIISGKVMELINSYKETMPVSVWMKKLSSKEELRCLVVMEPVERTVAKFSVSSDGKIIACDITMSMLFAYTTPEELKELNIIQLIPSLSLPLLNTQDKTSNGTKKIEASGRTRNGAYFPLTVMFKHECDNSNDISDDKVLANVIYSGVIWVFANISGMITILPNGTIHSCNTNFSQMLFGFSQEELIGKNITVLIPSFYDDLEFLDTDSIPLPPLDDDEDEDDDDDSHINCISDGRITADSLNMESRPMNPIGKQVELAIESSIDAFHCLTLNSSSSPSQNYSTCSFSSENAELLQNKMHLWENKIENSPDKVKYNEGQCTLQSHVESDINDNIACTSHLEVNPKHIYCESETGGVNYAQNIFQDNHRSEELYSKKEENPNRSRSEPTLKECTSISMTISATPRELLIDKMTLIDNKHISNESLHSFPEGNYFGLGKHRDGCKLAITYQIRRIELDNGQVVYCLWVSRDEETKESHFCNLLDTSVSSMSGFTIEPSKSVLGSSLTEKGSLSCNADYTGSEVNDSVYTSGAYFQDYTILQQIGKGAFGCVKMAYRNSDKLLVVTKFIRKSTVYPECWAYNSVLEKEVPLEISLLITLKHPNIVEVIDVLENDDYFQMVMEKHGSGMDLFEFVDRSPSLDEPLASYIFRQVVSALVYLHNRNILHRDIKDENIIMDHHFHIKLIDFGSAAFMQEGHYFSTFCGTMEYCSPEVLKGNKYAGPELEMWALGVTLYTLIFGENPFFDVDETIAAVLQPPFQVSQDLMSLITWLLNPDPSARCTLECAANHNWTNQFVDIHNYKFEDIVLCSAEEINPVNYFENPKSE
ncbi:PAS domain-containing serine/threonine-protein kinase-like [Centruroides vittatus]|uniref:PAS domain-containing serine/threonine-protein kinase-like n=1 Tax=Centruroides vittatus TaxID=120091 RepID=UPI00350F51A0